MLILILIQFYLSSAVDHSKFRTCADTGFCRRYRGKEINPEALFSIDASSLEKQVSNGRILGVVSGGSVPNSLKFELSVNIAGSVRVRITENELRWQPEDILLAQALAPGKLDILSPSDPKIPAAVRSRPSGSFTAVDVGNGAVIVLRTSPAPLMIELFQDGVPMVTANSRSLMHFEARRKKESDMKHLADASADKHGGKQVVDYGEDGLAIYADGSREEKVEAAVVEAVDELGEWEESFNGHTDKKPSGPTSVGMDFLFPSAKHAYGLPEHTSPLALRTTIAGDCPGSAPEYREPYRLYNLDVFEYELDVPMALYGNIPLMIAHGKADGRPQTAGMFWFNPSETFVDLSLSSGRAPQTHWISESGEIDFFLLPGPTPAAVYRQYTQLTGTQQLPPLFSLGYHQCRWNYRDEKDVAAVEGMFEALDFPSDVIWLDIEHTDGKRYFTWDKNLFPQPEVMLKNVSAHGRKMVTIVDPHIKRDDGYPIHKEATEKGLYIRTADNTQDFDGWCWPGSSSYLDFTSPRVREWWASRFSLSRYVGSTMDLFTWNDMNEPSVFNGPEVSMPKDCLSLAGGEHREWHNLYGLYMQRATAEGLTLRDPKKMQRPFVLSRAFWAGSQRFGAIWTGDNQATWAHLQIAAPMLLSINIAGLSFAGADVGGFFGNPDEELFTRWFQAGAFTPFFRGHAHHDTKRREPWVFGEPYTTILRSTAMIRYSLLPYWYSVFYEAHSSGMPVMRPLFTEFPDEEDLWTVDDQWMVGGALMVKPVTSPGVTAAEVWLPGTTGWFDFYSLQAVVTTPAARTPVSAPLEYIPVFIRGGHVLPRKMRLRRSASLMFHDPYTLVVAPDATGRAIGSLYLDDESTLAHEVNKAFAIRSFLFENNRLKCFADEGTGEYTAGNTIERVVFAGQSSAPSRVFVRSKGTGADWTVTELVFAYDADNKVVTVKKPDVHVTSDWELVLEP